MPFSVNSSITVLPGPVPSPPLPLPPLPPALPPVPPPLVTDTICEEDLCAWLLLLRWSALLCTSPFAASADDRASLRTIAVACECVKPTLLRLFSRIGSGGLEEEEELEEGEGDDDDEEDDEKDDGRSGSTFTS